MPISSCNSRISVASGRSPGSTLPPGNSHKPASVLPCGRCAISTRLSASTSAQATTTVRFILRRRKRGPRRPQRPRRHAPPPGLAFGEPDDKLQRGIQYYEAKRQDLERHGVLDRPLSRTMTLKMWSGPCHSWPIVSRPVIAVDRDIFLGEVAGQHAVAAFTQAERDFDLDLRMLH